MTDTPPVLKAARAEAGADPKIWTFLTGDRDDIDRFAARFGVSVTRAHDRSARHHAQPAHGDRRPRRETWSRSTPATSGRRIRCSRMSRPLSALTRVESPRTRPLPAGLRPRERRLIARLRTPLDVQRYLNRLPYNTEPRREARRSAASAASSATAARIASRRPCSRPSCSSSTATRRSC